MVTRQCYSGNVAIAKGYFLCVVDLYKDKDFECPLAVMLNLVCYKCGDKAAVIRKHSMQLLQLFSAGERGVEGWSDGESDNESDDEGSHGNYDYPLSLDSSLQDTIQRSQYNLSLTLAAQHPKLAPSFLTDCLTRLDSLETYSRKQILTYVTPWIQKIDLNDGDNTVQTRENLENLLLVTLKYADDHPHHLQSMWTTIAEKVAGPTLSFSHATVLQHRTRRQVPARGRREEGKCPLPPSGLILVSPEVGSCPSRSGS